MDQIDGRKILWENLSALMLMKYGKENMSKLAHDAHIGAATMTRIKEQSTSVGTENLDKLAAAFEVQAWQLICPGFDFRNKGAQNAPAKSIPLLGKDLQQLFDMIPDGAPTKEPAYFTCFDALMMARRQAASPPNPDKAPAQNQEKQRV